tara:strand:+ start:251 stop:400 length:150 start_codon:yes stop_codon:yes gene_type:complete
MDKSKTKEIEQEKLVAINLKGRFAMISLRAALSTSLQTGQIILGLYKFF